MKIKFITFDEYREKAKKDTQWKSYDKRWIYHALAIDILKDLNIKKSSDVLEIGSLGINIVSGSDTMDWTGSGWENAGYPVKYDMDARNTPWPIDDKQYLVVVALRVFHHLYPAQEAVFKECKRVAENVLLCCPEKETVGVGIPMEKFIEWNGGEAKKMIDLGEWGIVYLF